jgi:glycosyltransferase involved in cell wall biosynthesis
VLPAVRIAVIIPAGPRDDLLDTLASVVQYTDPSRTVLVIDDNPALSASYADMRRLSSDIEVIKAPQKAPGAHGGLWVKLAAGYRWILDRCQPRMILRLDADALILGSGVELEAGAVFARDHDVGLLGSYRLGPDGRVRDFSPTGRVLRAEAGFRGLRHPKCRSSLRRLMQRAEEHGYIHGEHVLGGAYIHSYHAAARIYEKGWLNQPWFASSKLGEDHIMSLLTIAAGFRLADFGRPGDPMALKWHGLPAHPAGLLADGKLITHSVRSWRELDERQIRDIFAAARTQSDSQPQISGPGDRHESSPR